MKKKNQEIFQAPGTVTLKKNYLLMKREAEKLERIVEAQEQLIQLMDQVIVKAIAVAKLKSSGN